MQLKADVLEVERDAATGVTVEIASVATAVPQYTITQDDAALRAQLKWSFEDCEVQFAENRAQAIVALRMYL